MVFVDTESTVYDASLSLTNIDGNNNKFYYIQLLNGYGQALLLCCMDSLGPSGRTGPKKARAESLSR